MSVHIYKYGLQWIYDVNVSSGINVRFCAYCAHFPGIDTTWRTNQANHLEYLKY